MWRFLIISVLAALIPQLPAKSSPLAKQRARCNEIWTGHRGSVNSTLRQIRRYGRGSGGILNIHVGKTCGTTINAVLSRARFNFSELHVKSVGHKSLFEIFDTVVLSIRDPINRTISAFNFHHPLSKGKTPGGGPTHSGDKLFYECFQTVEQFAQALNESGACGEQARKGYGHMKKGLCHYVGGTSLRKFLMKSKKFYVVEQEKCTEQLLQVLRAIHQPVPAKLLEGSWINKKTKLPYNVSLLSGMRVNALVGLPKNLTASAMKKLRAHLDASGEYDLYLDLKSRALKPRSKGKGNKS